MKTELMEMASLFEVNQQVIVSMQKKVDKLRRDYKNAWSKIWAECEKNGHGEKRMRKKGMNIHGRCPYCRRPLPVVGASFVSWNPDDIFRLEYCQYWLDIDENDWPEEKRDMLKKIKSLLKQYTAEAIPEMKALEELRERQKATRAFFGEIFDICDGVLGIRAEYEAKIKAAKRCSPRFERTSKTDTF